MSEKLGSVEHLDDKPETQTNHEVSTTPEAPPQQVEQKAETEAEAPDIERTRKRIDEIHEPAKGTLDESAQSAPKILRVPFPNLEPVVESITKTWGSIRQNLSPSQKTFSKVIHNPVVSNVSEFTAKTLARPYAILSGGITAIIGSSVYLYYTRHLGYQYNYFVPILLFAAGLLVGIVVEMFYKFFAIARKK